VIISSLEGEIEKRIPWFDPRWSEEIYFSRIPTGRSGIGVQEAQETTSQFQRQSLLLSRTEKLGWSKFLPIIAKKCSFFYIVPEGLTGIYIER
jgi:hypothetical protein